MSGLPLSLGEERKAQVYNNWLFDRDESRKNKKNAHRKKIAGENLDKGEVLLAQLYEEENAQRRAIYSRAKDAFHRQDLVGEALSVEEAFLAEWYTQGTMYKKDRISRGKDAFNRQNSGQVLSPEELLLVQAHKNKSRDDLNYRERQMNAVRLKKDGAPLTKQQENYVASYDRKLCRERVRRSKQKNAVENISAEEKLSQEQQHQNELMEAKQLRQERKKAFNKKKAGKSLSPAEEQLAFLYEKLSAQHRISQANHALRKKARLNNAQQN